MEASWLGYAGTQEMPPGFPSLPERNLDEVWLVARGQVLGAEGGWSQSELKNNCTEGDQVFRAWAT